MASDILDNPHKIKLVDATDPAQRFVLDVSTDVVESKSVEYKTYNPAHAPGGIHVFSHSASRLFTLSGVKLISRTEEEATINLARLSLLRSWAVPSFGDASKNDVYNEFDGVSQIEKEKVFAVQSGDDPLFTGRKTFGSPPPVLLFSAYSNVQGINKRRNIHRIPVVITQYTIPYSSDTDYIPTSEETGRVPMPTIMSVDLTMTETHSPNELSKRFSLQQYKQGILDNY